MMTLKAFLLLHEESLAEFGGARGLRDEGLLDSALARPQNAHACNDGTTFAELAASYGFGIAKNHAFLDGNKRAAFMAVGLFLAVNGYRLIAGKAMPSTLCSGLPAGTSANRTWRSGTLQTPRLNETPTYDRADQKT